jgi:hypothetical protein
MSEQEARRILNETLEAWQRADVPLPLSILREWALDQTRKARHTQETLNSRSSQEALRLAWVSRAPRLTALAARTPMPANRHGEVNVLLRDARAVWRDGYKPAEGSLRVWHVRQRPRRPGPGVESMTIRAPVDTIDEAAALLRTLELCGGTGECCESGLSIFLNGKWTEWEDDDGYDIIMHIAVDAFMRNRLRRKCPTLEFVAGTTWEHGEGGKQ